MLAMADATLTTDRRWCPWSNGGRCDNRTSATSSTSSRPIGGAGRPIPTSSRRARDSSSRTGPAGSVATSCAGIVEAVTLRDRAASICATSAGSPAGSCSTGARSRCVRPARRRRPTRTASRASGSVAGAGARRSVGAGEPDLGRGQPRRRTGRARLGRRPPRARHRRRADARRRRPRRARSPSSARRAQRRLGVLLDHLVAGSKETRLAADGRRSERADHRPPVRRRVGRRSGRGARPRRAGRTCPRGVPWKEGCAPRSACRLDGFWPRLRNQVHDATPTSDPNSSAPSSASSTSSPPSLTSIRLADRSDHVRDAARGLADQAGSTLRLNARRRLAFDGMAQTVSPSGPVSGTAHAEAEEAQAVPPRPLLDGRRQEVRDGDHRHHRHRLRRSPTWSATSRCTSA